MHSMRRRRKGRRHKSACSYFATRLWFFQFPISLTDTDMRLMDTKPHLSTKTKPKSTSAKVQQNAVGVVMSVHFSFNNCGVSVLHMFLEQTLDAHGHRIPSKHGEERGEEGDSQMRRIFFGVDSVELEFLAP